MLPLLPGAPVALGPALALPKKVRKPEGLAFLGEGLIAVADDRKDARDNLTVLRIG